MRNIASIFLVTSFLSACDVGSKGFNSIEIDSAWRHHDNDKVMEIDNIAELKGWWQKVDDVTLNNLVNMALKGSPDRNIASARIAEARGLRKANRSFLFPQIGATAQGYRQDSGFGGVANDFGDARFDVSYEIDLWGKNSKNLESSDLAIESLQQNYEAVSLSLISEVVRAYVEYREFERQASIARRNLAIQEKTLELARKRYKAGESSSLDVDRSSNLVNNTRASIPEFERVKNNKKLEIAALIGESPSVIDSSVDGSNAVPEFRSDPILLSPANVIANRPDVKAANLNLASKTKLAESVVATLFPSLNISGFYGLSDSSVMPSEKIWNIALGAAVNLIDFGRIEGRIDASRARELQAFEEYRKSVVNAVVDVERALNDYTKIEQKKTSLYNAFNSAKSAHETSKKLYNEGEISFIDVLDSERSLNEADSAYVAVKAEHTKSVVRLYKSLGVY